jgi:hypothetical protein
MLIKMATFSFPNASAGVDASLVGINQQVPSFIPIILFFVFVIIFTTGFVGQKRRTGSGDAPMWFVVSGISITVMTLILSTVDGLVNGFVLSTVIGITILSFVFLALTKGRYE